MPEVIMPKMGDAMEEGTLLKWLKSEGDDVSEGDAIAEIETDKVTLELEAEDSGTLAQLIASEGDEVPVGGAIAFIAGEGEEAPERGGGPGRSGPRAGGPLLLWAAGAKGSPSAVARRKPPAGRKQKRAGRAKLGAAPRRPPPRPRKGSQETAAGPQPRRPPATARAATGSSGPPRSCAGWPGRTTSTSRR